MPKYQKIYQFYHQKQIYSEEIAIIILKISLDFYIPVQTLSGLHPDVSHARQLKRELRGNIFRPYGT